MKLKIFERMNKIDEALARLTQTHTLARMCTHTQKRGKTEIANVKE